MLNQSRVGIASGAKTNNVVKGDYFKAEPLPATTLHYHRCGDCGVIIDCEGDNCVQPICDRCLEGFPW